MNRFENQVALVTGGARGIGEAITTQFAQEGAKVILVDILEDAAKETAKKLCDKGYDVIPYIVDLRPVENINNMVADVEKKYGRIDILVNCAGVNKICPAIDLKPEDFDFVMDVDLRSPLFLCIACAKVMMKQGRGKIVNISSGNSRHANVGRTSYCIAKGAINAMTNVLAAEWSCKGINVNAVAPGWIKTAMPTAAIKNGLLDEEAIMSISPIQRWGKAEEIADLVTFLASDAATYICGQTIFADGGWSTGIVPHALDYFKDK